MKIDDIDRKILNELMRDSRLSMSELGRRINLSSPSVSERVKQMESHGVIESYTTKVNLGKLGNDIQCIIEATVKNGTTKDSSKKSLSFQTWTSATGSQGKPVSCSSSTLHRSPRPKPS